MAFISYAQNYEDVVLYRALKNVDKGFYIDVGANDPISDSVTKAFYDGGWQGINIEPVSEWFEKLQEDRPKDINLQIAAGPRKGKSIFYEVVGTGLSTMDKSIAEGHAKDHGFDIKKYQVPVIDLTTICQQYVHSEIQFLKIDVEGFELKVLQGINLKKIRPWIILVESTLPLTQIEKHGEWEDILLKYDYEYCYFDGLNRFYVAKEHHNIMKELSIPPNVFDGFLLSGKSTNITHHQIRDLEAELVNSGEQKQVLESALQQAEQNKQDMNEHLQGLQAEATRQQELLRQKEKREQELLLALLEKETKQQESNITLADHKRQLNVIKTELASSGEQKQVLESALQQAEQNKQDMNEHLQGLQAEATRQQELLRQKEKREQELLLALLEKETKQQESNITLADHKRQLNVIKTELAKSSEQKRASESLLQKAEQQLQEVNENSRSLQVERTHHRELLRQKDEALKSIDGEFKTAKQRIDELNQSNDQWWTVADQHSKSLVEAETKIKELNESSHHWWLESERLNKELYTVYHSRSWIVTWPLRRSSQFVQWIFFLLIKLKSLIIYLPKRISRWLLHKLIIYLLKSSKLKEQAINRLRNHPKLEMILRQLASAQRSVVVMNEQAVNCMATQQVSADCIETPAQVQPMLKSTKVSLGLTSLEPDLSSLTPSARRIFKEVRVFTDKRLSKIAKCDKGTN